MRPVKWWVWPAWTFGEAAAFFLTAVSPFLSIGWTVVWFSGLIVLAVREKRFRDEQRGLVRATVVGRPELSKPPARVLPSGRRALSDRVG